MKKSSIHTTIIIDICLFIIFITLISCSAHKIQIINTGNNSKLITLETWHKLVSGPLDNWKTIYKKEISNGNSQSMIIMNFYARPRESSLDEDVLLVIDNESYRLKFMNRKIRIEGQQTGSIGPWGVYESWKNIYGEIQLSPEIEKSLSNSKNVDFIISSGGSQTKLHILNDQLKKLKEFLAINK